MEFGTLIPLYYMALCCLITTPIIGAIALLFIRYSIKDTQLAKNILITVLVVSLCWFLYPIGQLIYAAVIIFICRTCPDSSLYLTSENLLMVLRFSIGLLLPGAGSGFALAFIFVVPITLLVRKFRRAKLSDGD